jgi:hypothetical protein
MRHAVSARLSFSLVFRQALGATATSNPAIGWGIRGAGIVWGCAYYTVLGLAWFCA